MDTYSDKDACYFQILLFFRLHVFDAQLFHHILTADLRDHMVVEDLHAGKTL